MWVWHGEKVVRFYFQGGGGGKEVVPHLTAAPPLADNKPDSSQILITGSLLTGFATQGCQVGLCHGHLVFLDINA